ncbi:MAG: helix-turn-helix domain-containing protein [Clostridia bacterium]|nr:helix-turn-helix domain-containing protein [Clostridia bacterium]
MNQQKTGEFLKHLRKEKGLTQEQLAERFYVSSRTISRWETGSNMPDVDMLIELADFYDVDIREIINGERKSENMNNETKDTLKKVAEYVAEESKKRKEKLRTMLAGSTILMLICYLLFGSEHKGRLNGIIPANIRADIMSFAIGFAIATLALYGLYCLGAFDKISQWKKNR